MCHYCTVSSNSSSYAADTLCYCVVSFSCPVSVCSVGQVQLHFVVRIRLIVLLRSQFRPVLVISLNQSASILSVLVSAGQFRLLGASIYGKIAVTSF